ncbi:unnamed protein product [marine sediment metagenome]|uniref:Uncharacterized protein n=1 Tax=marine sediment metagenome TaxID=412755 RepID=X0SBF6_9ZZZZ
MNLLNTSPEVPCIKDKCLKYPICRTRTILACDLLAEYYDKKHDTRTVSVVISVFNDDPIWSTIRKVIPRIIWITREAMTIEIYS